MTHTGVDYFCCNRARGEAELAAVSSANMRDFISTGGRFPIMAVTYDRAEMLDSTLKSLLAVRCVTPGDIFVIQDGAVEAVTDVARKRGVNLHQKDESTAMRKPQEGGAERIAQHFRYALSYMFSVGAPRAPAVIVIEDDFLFSSDFYEYFHAVAPALELDPSLWLASAWVRSGGCAFHFCAARGGPRMRENPSLRACSGGGVDVVFFGELLASLPPPPPPRLSVLRPSRHPPRAE